MYRAGLHVYRKYERVTYSSISIHSLTHSFIHSFIFCSKFHHATKSNN